MPNQVNAMLVAATLSVVVAFAPPASSADGDRLHEATEQVESGAKKTGEGITETASGPGQAGVEGTNGALKAVAGTARGTARVVGRVSRNVGEGAKNAWETVRDRLVDFGDSVVRLVKRPF